MGIIVRQSIQNTLISYLGIVLGFISTILLYPNILEPDQYGLTRLFLSLALVSSQFAHLGIKNVIIRYFPHFSRPVTSRRSFFTLSLIVPLIGFVLFSVLFFSFKSTVIGYYQDQSGLFSEFYLYLLPLVFAVLFFGVVNSYIRALQDSTTGSLLYDVVVRVIVIVLLILYYYGIISFTQFMALFVLNYSLQLLCLLIYLYLREELSFSIPTQIRNRKFFKEIGTYSLYSLLGGLSALLVGNIDIIMLASLTNLTNTGVYAIAFYVGSVIAVPQRSINKIAMPVLAGFMKNKKYREVNSLYERTSLNQVIAGSLLFIGIWANMHNLIDLLPPEYAGIKWVVVAVGLAKLFDMATGINGGIILNSRFYRFDLYTNVLLVVLTIVTNYLLIPPYGILGAAVATAFSIFVYNFIKFVFVWMKFGMQPFQWNALAVLTVAGGCLILSFQIPYMLNFFVDVAVRSLIIASLFLGLILMFNLSDDVGQLARHSLKKVKGLLSPGS